MRQDIAEAKERAEQARYLYNIGGMTRKEAESEVKPYLDMMYERGSEVAKKFGRKFYRVTFTQFVR